jgi:hypothetical protein
LTSGCDVTVNLKRVCDESSTVLKGIVDLMGGIAKIRDELAKGKACVEVEEKIEKVLNDGGAMLARFNKAMEPVKKRWKQYGHLLPKAKGALNIENGIKHSLNTRCRSACVSTQSVYQTFEHTKPLGVRVCVIRPPSSEP